MDNGDAKLLENNEPVPKPCGNELFSVYAHCDIALKPTLLSKALVTQYFVFFGITLIHSSEALKPPNKLGLRIIYCGSILSNNCILFSKF